MPVFAMIFLVMTMSSIGLPALNGFIGELLILQGVFVATSVGGVRGERHRAGRGVHAEPLPEDDVRQVENPRTIGWPTSAIVSSRRSRRCRAGRVDRLYPTPFLDRLKTSVDHVMARVDPKYAAKLAADCGSPLTPGPGRRW